MCSLIFRTTEFTIAQPGSLKFNGVKTKVIVNGAERPDSDPQPDRRQEI